MTARTPRRGAMPPLSAVTGAFAITAALLLTACGDQTDDGDDKQAQASDAPLHDKLPKRIQEAGELKVGSDIAYAPVEFKDENDEVVGIDPDLAEALGEQLGVEFTFEDGTFDNLILGLNSGRHDVIMSAMTDTKARQEGLDADGKKIGAGVDFVDYFRAGSAILVQHGNPADVSSLEDLCGKTVALQRGTANQELAEEQNESCDKKIKILDFSKDTEALVQLKQGRAQAVLNDYPVAAYNAKTAGGGQDFEVIGEQINAAPYGIAVSKQNPGIRDAIKAALDAVIDNGEYARVLEKWNAGSGAVEQAVINGGS